MKLYNFFFSVCAIYAGTIYSSDHTLIKDSADSLNSAKNNGSLELEEEMMNMPSFVRRSREQRERRVTFLDDDSSPSSAPDWGDIYRNLDQSSHSSRSSIQTSSSIDILTIRPPKREQISFKTQALFAWVAAFSFIELAFDVVNLYDYYALPHDPKDHPEFLIARVANSTTRVGALYAMYKINQERLR